MRALPARRLDQTAGEPGEAQRAPEPPLNAVLALQRSAGNAATGASLRMLARCGAGGCTCGGKCGGHGKQEPEELELQRMADQSGRQALARAVHARRALA